MDSARDFVARVAEILLDGEIDRDGVVYEMECDDAHDTLQSLIEQARELVNIGAQVQAEIASGRIREVTEWQAPPGSWKPGGSYDNVPEDDGTYLVTWAVDIDECVSHEQAARDAWRIMRQTDSTANVFTVRGVSGVDHRIDLDELDAVE